jgi:hypothetical protein
MSDEVKLPTNFRFWPWPQVDPVAPWILQQLEESELITLARVGLEMNKTILEAQVKAHDQALAVLNKSKRSR